MCLACTMCCVVFFFSSRRRHTRLQGDWSSDVCSSDLSKAATRAVRACRPSCRSRQQRALPRRRSSREDVAVQGIEGAAALLGGRSLRQRRRGAEHFAQARSRRTPLLRLLRRRANFLLQILGVLVAGFQLIRYLRGNPALRGVGLDIFDHLALGLAEIPDQLAGLVRGGTPVAGGLDQLAALLRLFPQGYESLHALVRGTGLRGRGGAPRQRGTA